MKSIVSGAIATLMLLGMLAAAVTPKQSKTNAPVTVAGGGGPMPMCYPSDPGCGPVIPPAAR